MITDEQKVLHILHQLSRRSICRSNQLNDIAAEVIHHFDVGIVENIQVSLKQARRR